MYFNNCPYGSQLQHYWDRLSRKERQMSLDEEALYSLVVQAVATEIAKATPGHVVADAFCGAGGFAIALAHQSKRVVAIDMSQQRLDMARNNAKLFEVSHSIDFIHGNCLQILPTIDIDTILLDPPWGGTDYNQTERFRLSDFRPNCETILHVAFSAASNVVLRLPKNFLFSDLDRFKRNYELQENIYEGRLLHYCVYFGGYGELG